MESPTLALSNPAEPSVFSLENILGDHEDLEHPKYREQDMPLGGWDEEAVEKPVANGFCIECEGSPPWYCFQY
jgi:hypothetical protein